MTAKNEATISLEQLRQNCSEDSCFLLIHGKVYDVTKFLDEHPGGYDIVIGSAGRDATEDFEEIGHSNAAKEMLDKYYIGEYEGGTAPLPKQQGVQLLRQGKQSSAASATVKALLPLLVILAAVLYALYGSK